MTRKAAALDSALNAAAQESGSREKLLAATLELLTGGCLHTISLRDIANAAKVNSALISYYFGGKEQLYAALIHQQFEDYRQQVVTCFKTEGDPRENLRTACAALASFHRSHPHWMLLYFRELTNPSPSYETVILPCIAEAAARADAMIQAGIDQGVFRADTNPRYVVQSLVGTINYSFLTNRLHRDLKLAPAEDLVAYFDFVLTMLQRQICTP